MESKAKKTAKKLVIIDDNDDDLKMLSNFLIPRGYEVVTTKTVEEARQTVKFVKPALIILDWELPGIKGIEALEEIQKAAPDSYILMLTIHRDMESKIKAFKAGVDDYLMKPCELEELEIRIENILQRQSSEPTETLQLEDIKLERGPHRVSKDGKMLELSVKEYSLLEYFMLNTNKVITRNMILQHIWGEAAETFTNIVDVYINYLRKKIDTPLHTSYIKTIRGAGYMMRDRAAEKRPEQSKKAA
ncbi:MAG: response regulator transcription factor [Deltaproteobacteria bacterium]|nr:response regulator transcription factor [Deltaproteobacteria bacterium]